MKRKASFLLWAFLLHAFEKNAMAEPYSAEADKAKRIGALLQEYPFTLQRGGGLGDRSADFCNGVLAAFKGADKAIEYIEPVVKTDDPKHPALARYNEPTCPNERGMGETTYGGDIRSIGDRAYRLYHIDVARKFKHGLEEIVYGEQIIPVSEEGSIARFTGFQQVNFDRCEHYPVLAVTPQEMKLFGIKETLNSMVRYRGKYYVVHLWRGADSSGTSVPIWLHAYKPLKTGVADFRVACYWKYSTATPSGE